MKLPNPHLAIVEREKVVGYLLNAAHPDNGGKARFFYSLGFSQDHWETFATALCELAKTTEVVKSMESQHGQKYVLDGRIGTTGGKTPVVRTIWIVDHGLDRPRLVTAYPHEE